MKPRRNSMSITVSPNRHQHDSPRQVTLRLGPLYLDLTTTEAIELANNLVDVAESTHADEVTR